MLLPAARQTPNLEDQWLERSNSRHKAPPASEATRANPAAEGGSVNIPSYRNINGRVDVSTKHYEKSDCSLQWALLNTNEHIHYNPHTFHLHLFGPWNPFVKRVDIQRSVSLDIGADSKF